MGKHKPLENSHFLVVGLVRNCETSVKKDVEVLRKSLEYCESISWLLVESDSTDSTEQLLEYLKSIIDSFDYISLGQLDHTYPKRTERIAFCRNVYLKEIRKNPKYRDIDYILVADFDGINRKLNAESVRSCWKRKDWDVCCANQDGPYYDIWALRHSLWSPNDCWAQQIFLKNHGVGHFNSVFSSVYTRMIKVPKTNDWIDVDSAFGGCAIYRRDLLVNVSYVGLTETGQEICEHVELHRQIRNAGGRIFVNPEFINAGLVEHAKFSYGLNLLFFWFKSTLKNLLNLLKLI